MTDNQIEPHNPGAPVAAEGPTENVPADRDTEAKVSDTGAAKGPAGEADALGDGAPKR